MTCASTASLGYVSFPLYILSEFFVHRSQPANGTTSPINAMTVSLGITVILTSIVIGSTTAYGVFVTLVNSGLLSSYMICIACKSFR